MAILLRNILFCRKEKEKLRDFYQFLSFLCRFCKSTDDAKKQKVSQILERLLNLTIEQKEMYPSIQAKIWGSIGQVRAPPRIQAKSYSVTTV